MRGFSREFEPNRIALAPSALTAILHGLMPAPPTDARSFSARVARIEPCGADAFRLELDVDLPPIRASRFFMLRRESPAGAPIIPRPYSIYRQRPGRIEFLIQRLGPGSAALLDAEIGSEVRAIGPLGNGWPGLEPRPEPLVLLAGGVGSAPFPLLVDQLLSGFGGAPAFNPSDVHFLFGARSRDRLYDLEALKALPVPFHAATQDGSWGFHGHGLELLEHLQQTEVLPERVRLLACGPEPMLEAVERLALERGYPTWLSLESYMGCGVGICNGCPVPTREGGPMDAWPNAKCCVEGPVFPVEAVDLAALH